MSETETDSYEKRIGESSNRLHQIALKAISPYIWISKDAGNSPQTVLNRYDRLVDLMGFNSKAPDFTGLGICAAYTALPIVSYIFKVDPGRVLETFKDVPLNEYSVHKRELFGTAQTGLYSRTLERLSEDPDLLSIFMRRCVFLQLKPEASGEVTGEVPDKSGDRMVI